MHGASALVVEVLRIRRWSSLGFHVTCFATFTSCYCLREWLMLIASGMSSAEEDEVVRPRMNKVGLYLIGSWLNQVFLAPPPPSGL